MVRPQRLIPLGLWRGALRGGHGEHNSVYSELSAEMEFDDEYNQMGLFGSRLSACCVAITFFLSLLRELCAPGEDLLAIFRDLAV